MMESGPDTWTYDSGEMNIIFHYAAGPTLSERLSGLDAQGLQVSVCPESDDSRFAELLPDCDVIWHVLAPIDVATIEAAPKLRLIQKIGVGVNTIDLDAAQRHGISVCNMPGTNSRAVAEMTLFLILGALRRGSQLDAAVRAGRGWDLPAVLQDRCGEVRGRTIGLVGYGAVPRLLAPVLVAMGARVLYSSRRPQLDAVGVRCPFDTLLAESDVVSLHLPLTSETRCLIDASAIDRMRREAIIINTARGALIDESALLEALRTGRIRAAGLDVFATEPISPDNPLLALDNVVVSPHVAWLTSETMERSVTVAAENCRRLDAGETLLHRVV